MIGVDASVVVAALVDAADVGAWAEGILASGSLVAPHLMPAGVTNVLRRAVLAGEVSPEGAELALADLTDARVDLYPFAPFASRVWDVRGNVSAYDAWYVEIAEALDAPLVTLDTRLWSAPGPRCQWLMPSPSSEAPP